MCMILVTGNGGDIHNLIPLGWWHKFTLSCDLAKVRQSMKPMLKNAARRSNRRGEVASHRNPVSDKIAGKSKFPNSTPITAHYHPSHISQTVNGSARMYLGVYSPGDSKSEIGKVKDLLL